MGQEPNRDAVIEIDGARKSFGAVTALDGASFSIAPGECVGLVGHNGAGKSTLVNVINGGLSIDAGTIRLGGSEVAGQYSIQRARAEGIRCVFQELSLCPNLTVVENTRINHAGLGQWGWRGRARTLIAGQLDEIFPKHGIDCGRAVGDLSISERQMVEIAMAFARLETPARLVILDEPTSSLDASLARHLVAYVRRFIEAGGAVIFISHILGEVLDISDRVVVMRDGKVVAERPASEFTEAGLVQAMGSVAAERQGRRTAGKGHEDEPLAQIPAQAGDATGFKVYRGETLGLAGLAGHGQTKMLEDLYLSLSGDWRANRNPKTAFVAGDRHIDGVFPLWSIMRNASLAVLQDLTTRGLVGREGEARFAADWRQRMGLRTDNLSNPILSLSGGNQQKVLFARALGTRANLVLMDDPMRGVDIGTKQDVYAMIRAEADKGRTFVWYSTETDELCLCDRVYVFREGRIVAELQGDDVDEANILAASFASAAA